MKRLNVHALTGSQMRRFNEGAVVAPAPAPVAPAWTSTSTLAGTPTVGSTLTATPGTYTGSPAPTVEHRWHRRQGTAPWVQIAGESGATYLVVAGDAGYRVRSLARLVNSAGTTAWTTATPTNGLGPITAGV